MSVEPLLDKMGSSSSTATVPKTEKAINVACYNVYFKGYDREGTIDGICPHPIWSSLHHKFRNTVGICIAILSMEVDILILQETNQDWENVIVNNQAIQSKFKYIRCVNDKYGV